MLASSISGTWADNALACFFSSLLLLDTPFSPLRLLRSFQASVLVAYAALYAVASFWLGHVTRVVREPYMDEEFHIPQALAYCNGRYEVWDPKLTTPPGLYMFATIYAKAVAHGKCSPALLRSFNVFALIMLFSYACDCRALIFRTRRTATRSSAPNAAFQVYSWSERCKHLSPNEIHTALNVALFPLLFFFSGLFYTDILSTCLVLRAYRLFLERKGAYNNSGEALVWLYVTGIVSLWMRQTNIFWVAVFLGGLELVRTLDANQAPSPENETTPYALKDIVVFHLRRYSRGQIHDLPLNNAGVQDFILCAISIVIATAFRPFLVTARLWPYISLLFSFAGFVFWNGGVVLGKHSIPAATFAFLTFPGDKANHVATIHIPQMLYIWPFIAFFSAPLIIPVALSLLQRSIKLLALPLFPRLVWQYLLTTTYSALALAAALAIVKFNTIIHPFTLADNRHYMFYVFRYTILRHALVRYLATPVYLVFGYLAYLTLFSQPPASQVPNLKEKKNTTAGLHDRPEIKTRSTSVSEGPTTSFVLVLLLTSTLSLITAPLVEPRYFILPWVIWRLNVPALPSRPPTSTKSGNSAAQVLIDRVRFWGWRGHDYRLWLETGWFLGINAVTGYIFLWRGFEARGGLTGVQRFMW